MITGHNLLDVIACILWASKRPYFADFGSVSSGKRSRNNDVLLSFAGWLYISTYFGNACVYTATAAAATSAIQGVCASAVLIYCRVAVAGSVVTVIVQFISSLLAVAILKMSKESRALFEELKCDMWAEFKDFKESIERDFCKELRDIKTFMAEMNKE